MLTIGPFELAKNIDSFTQFELLARPHFKSSSSFGLGKPVTGSPRAFRNPYNRRIGFVSA
jgi:hypothetical protein